MKSEKFSLLFWFYLMCSIVGAIVPWYYNIEAMKQRNTFMILPYYFAEGTATPLACSITTDFFIGTVPVLVWMLVDAKQNRLKYWWLFLPATFLVSFAFSCPLFLAIKEYKLSNGLTAQSPSFSSNQKLSL